jgi:hypothetical protein
MRLYLNFFFFGQHFYDSAVLVSHFVIFLKSNLFFVHFFFYPGFYFEYFYNAELKDQEFMFFLKGGRYKNPNVKQHKYAPELIMKNKSLHNFMHYWKIENSL